MADTADTADLDRFIANLNRRPAGLGDIALGHLSGEARAIAEAKIWAQALSQRDPAYGRVVAVLIAARRLYAAAYTHLNNLLQNEQPPPSDMTEDYFIQAALHTATKPFEETSLINLMTSTVMPWLAEVVDAHLREQEKAFKDAVAEAEAQRRQRPLPLPFPLNVDAEALTLPRDRPLCLVGWSCATGWLLRHIIDAVIATEPPFQVVHFAAINPKRGEISSRMVRVGPSLWRGCADRRTSMPTIMGVLLDRLSTPPDLVVCDDLSLAYGKGYTGRPQGANAGDGNRAIALWCRESGCALLGAVPSSLQEPPDLSHPQWEQLRAYTTLLEVVAVPDGEEHYSVTVGKGLGSWRVPRTELEAAGQHSIVVPTGMSS